MLLRYFTLMVISIGFFCHTSAIAQNYDDELDVYESEAYSNGNADNDVGYYYQQQGQVYEPITPSSPQYNDYSDELDVYESDIYSNQYIENDESYSNIKNYEQPESITPYGEEDYIPYTQDYDSTYQPLNNFNGDNDQMMQYYDTERSASQENNYDPSQDFYPDYYDY